MTKNAVDGTLPNPHFLRLRRLRFHLHL